MSLFNLDGKIALVTGSTDGLGKAIALGLGKANATIVVNGRSSIDKLNRVVEEFNKDGINASGSLCDVTDEAQVTEMVENIEINVGAIDILINNAGINIRSGMIDMPLEKFKSNLDINLLGPFIVSKIVAKRMIKRQSGKIINICSLMSELGRNSVGAYAASKGGLKMLTQNMATEWAKHNIQ
ncbi:MAG: SDR family NAD(P)-dependent oxidoreductase, partial [Cyclobacteriaceae bacterium]|nr:SDR family NAD(P)-dependent oxidoreductase [Cyclobacteriaceae bacterium]